MFAPSCAQISLIFFELSSLLPFLAQDYTAMSGCISVLEPLHLCLIILSAHWTWPILTWARKSSQGPYLTPFHFTHFSLPRKGPFCWVFPISNTVAQLVPHRLQATLSSIGFIPFRCLLQYYFLLLTECLKDMGDASSQALLMKVYRDMGINVLRG